MPEKPDKPKPDLTPSDKKERLTAVALKYKMNIDPAPIVVAKGKGLIAERIIQIAQEHHIPIREDPDLVEVLAKLELNQFIPTELFQAVAEILAFIYRMSDKRHQNLKSNL
jgi:flagellar biosynthesis protein